LVRVRVRVFDSGKVFEFGRRRRDVVAFFAPPDTERDVVHHVDRPPVWQDAFETSLEDAFGSLPDPLRNGILA
jgi:hypothetical protein